MWKSVFISILFSTFASPLVLDDLSNWNEGFDIENAQIRGRLTLSKDTVIATNPRNIECTSDAHMDQAQAESINKRGECHSTTQEPKARNNIVNISHSSRSLINMKDACAKTDIHVTCGGPEIETEEEYPYSDYVINCIAGAVIPIPARHWHLQTFVVAQYCCAYFSNRVSGHWWSLNCW